MPITYEHQFDVRRIGEVFAEAARRHSHAAWFNDTVEELNKRLHQPLELCEQRWIVTQSYTVTRRMVVTAANEYDIDPDEACYMHDLYDDPWEIVDVTLDDQSIDSDD